MEYKRLIIRKATRKDLDVLAKMNHEFKVSEKKISDKYLKVPSLINLKRRLMKHLANRNIIFLIAEKNQEAIGFSKGVIESGKSDYEYIDKVGFVGITYIKKPYRKKGIAMELYRRMVKEFRKKGVKMITVFNHSSNKPAIEFSKKRGFKVHSIELRKFI